MKRFFTAILAAAILSSACACTNTVTDPDSAVSQVQTAETAAPVKLVNKMTEAELKQVDKHGLTLLDEPVQQEETPSAAEITDHKVEAYVTILTVDMLPDCIDGCKQDIENEESDIQKKWIQKAMERMQAHLDAGKELKIIGSVLVDGNICMYFPQFYDDDFDGKIEFLNHVADPDGNDLTLEECSFENMDEYIAWVRKQYADYDAEDIVEKEIKKTMIAYDALKSGNYETLIMDENTDLSDPSLYDDTIEGDGDAAPVILVSIWYSYDVPYNGGEKRYEDLVINRDKLLDFLTDNLMPYLGENYNINFAESTLYGHSDGGVFAHNALFKSDLYENQPFGSYIIGSPAFWGLLNYNDAMNIDNADFENNYGFFDRNEKLNKRVFLCAGSQEDPDYKDNYNGHDTTLEGTAKLKDLLESHNADLTYKLYDSHHYQYIPEMLIEYLKAQYQNK